MSTRSRAISSPVRMSRRTAAASASRDAAAVAVIRSATRRANATSTTRQSTSSSPLRQARAATLRRDLTASSPSPALSLPQTAVQLRDGFSYVFRVGPDRRVAMTKVALGRRAGDRVEILTGLDAAAQVVASGVGFLADGDLVKVVGAPAPVAAAAPAAPAASR